MPAARARYNSEQMIPIRLRISGFLSYHDPVELDFTRFDLACISGQNGAGKSSLLDAITWALFGQARRRDEALINLQSKAADVTLIFQYEGAIYRIQRALPRGKSGILEFQRLETEKTPAVPVTAPDGENRNLNIGCQSIHRGGRLRSGQSARRSCASRRRCASITRPSSMQLSSCRERPTSSLSRLPASARMCWAASWAWRYGSSTRREPATSASGSRKTSRSWSAASSRSIRSLVRIRHASSGSPSWKPT